MKIFHRPGQFFGIFVDGCLENDLRKHEQGFPKKSTEIKPWTKAFDNTTVLDVIPKYREHALNFESEP